MSEYRLYIFLMDGRLKIGTRAKSYEIALARIQRRLPDTLELVEVRDDPFNGSEIDRKPFMRFEPVKVAAPKTQTPNANLYAQAINKALEGQQ